MPPQVILATYNKGKIKEFKEIFNSKNINVEILTLQDVKFDRKIVEDGETFLDNARKKASFLFNIYHIPVIADDSGLIVEALGGEPGVFSARYAGEGSSDKANNDKLIDRVKNLKDRKAFFQAVIVFVNKNGDFFEVEDRCYGEIIDIPRGDKGFGYDPIFYLPQYGETMAEIDITLKNKISHRGKALEKLIKVIMENLNE